jgi:hypothetical protein
VKVRGGCRRGLGPAADCAALASATQRDRCRAEPSRRRSRAIKRQLQPPADSAANLAVYSRQRGGATGGTSFPMLGLLTLVSCGSRTLIDAVFGPVSSGETTYAADLLASLRPGMILLAARNFGAGFLAAQIAAARAGILIRVRTGNGSPKLPVLRRLPDSSWLSRLGGIPVRVVDAETTVTTSGDAPRAAAGWSPP